jgi:hypothetical protein
VAIVNKVGGAAFEIQTVFDQSSLSKKLAAIQKELDRAGNHWRAYGDSMKRSERIQRSFFDRYKSGWERGILTGAARGENAFNRLSTAFAISGQAFEQVNNDVQRAALSFQSLQRKGYFLQAGLGTLAGTIGDLSGGFLSLVGVVGQAAGSMYGVVGAIATFVAAGVVAKFALGGVGQAVSQLWTGQQQYNKALLDAKRNLRDLRFAAEEAALSEEEAAINLEKARETLARVQDLPPDNRVRREAELAFKQADLNYRKVKASSEDARADAKRGILPTKQTDPFINLTASQKVFAKYILTTKSAIMQLKESAAGAFLPGLQTAIQGFIKNVFPTLNAGFKDVGDGLSSFVNRLSDAFQTPENLKSLREFFANSKDNLDLFGKAAADGLGAFLSLLVNIQPLIDKFGTWLSRYFGRLDTYFKSAEFDRFINKSMEVAGLLGDIFHDVFTGIGNIMKAAFPDDGKGGGYILLDWLDRITEGFKAFTGSSEFKTWLADSTRNATTALSTIGQFLHIFLDLAGSIETFEFWTIIREAVGPLRDILKAGMLAGPAFAKFLVAFTKFIAIFLDNPDPMIGFFDTLTKIVEIFDSVLRPMKPFLDFLGKIHGPLLAIGAAFLAMNTVGIIFQGTVSIILRSMGNILSSIFNLGQSINLLKGKFNQAAGALKTFGLRNAELLWGYRAGRAGVKAFWSSLNETYRVTDRLGTKYLELKILLSQKLTGAISASKRAFSGWATSATNSLRNLSTAMKTSISALPDKFKLLRNSLATTVTSTSAKLGILANSTKATFARMGDSIATGVKKFKFNLGMLQAALADSKKKIAASRIDTYLAGGFNNFVPRNNRQILKAYKAEQLNAVRPTGFAAEGRFKNPIKPDLAAQASAQLTATRRAYYDFWMGQTSLRTAFGRKIAIMNTVDATKRVIAEKIASTKILANKIAAETQWFGYRTKHNILSTARDIRDSAYVTALRIRNHATEIGAKIAKESQWFAYRTKHNLLNPGYIKREVATFWAGIKQKIAAQDIFDTKRRTSFIEQLKYLAIEGRESTKLRVKQLAQFSRNAIIQSKQHAKLIRDNIARESQWFAYRSKHNILSFGRNLRNIASTIKAEGLASATILKNKIAKEAQWFAYRSKHNFLSFKEEMKWIAYRAKANIMNPTWLTGSNGIIKNVQRMFAPVGNAMTNAAMKSRLSWAASLGATETELKKLMGMMDGLTAKEIRNNAAINAMLPGYGGFRGTMGRFAGRAGTPLMMAGMAGMMMGPQPSTPGVGSMISGISSLGMMIPGAGMAIGGAGMIVGAIVSGFEAAAEKEKERQQLEDEKKRKIEVEKLEAKIKLAEIRVEKEKKFGGETLEYMKQAGLDIKEAGVAALREGEQAGVLATKYNLPTITLDDGTKQTATDIINSFRDAFIQGGLGSEFAKDTEKSNKLLQAAAALSLKTKITDPAQIIDAINTTFSKEGIPGLDKIIAEDTRLFTSPTGKNLITDKAGEAKFRRMESAANAIEKLEPVTTAFDNALSELSSYKKTNKFATSVDLGSKDALETDLDKYLAAAGFDFSKLKAGEFSGSLYGYEYKIEDLQAEIERQMKDPKSRLYQLQNQAATGIVGATKSGNNSILQALRGDDRRGSLFGKTVPPTKIDSSTTSPVIVKPVPMDEKNLPSYKQRALQLAEAQLQTAILQNMLKLDRNPKATDLTDLKPLENAVTRLRSEVGGSSNWSPAVP